MGNAFTLMVICGILLTILGIVFRRPLLYLFGASDSTYPYAESYMTIYLLGSVFVMMGLGMNAFINSQGFGRIGMQTVLLGAVANIILDPVFIFGFRMDVRGAALATIISQFLSAAWVLRFLFSDRSILRLKRETMVLKKARVLKIVSMGMSSFAAGFTNSVVAVACNATLQTWGGDLYVGVMTVIHSVREIAENLVKGLTGGSQPVLGYNFGAGQYDRVKKAIRFYQFPPLPLPPSAGSRSRSSRRRLSTSSTGMKPWYRRLFRQYGSTFSAFYDVSSVFGTGLLHWPGKGQTGHLFFHIPEGHHRFTADAFIPKAGRPGAMGVFLAEPVSNFIGGAACYGTMLRTVWPELNKKKRKRVTGSAEDLIRK